CLDEQVAAYAEAGVDGVYTNGTAAEFHCQSDADFREVSTRVARLCADHALAFQLGATHPLPAATLERIRFAGSLGPGALQVILPDWTPIDLATARRFLIRCADVAGDVPLVLYNPPHAKTVLTPADYLDLAEAVPQLVGIKCAGGDAGWYEAMAPVIARLSVFIPGHHMASGRARGAHGAYSNMACLNPTATVAWNRLITERPDAGLELETRIGRFMDNAIAPVL
ncbi:MAG: dihydrodipicolinate synthase family protein, partial [Hyphomicrobiales bacterium]|nr:dihydrodipicolinate synthase family protein [Hyphomicrobiales bacterium]